MQKKTTLIRPFINKDIRQENRHPTGETKKVIHLRGASYMYMVKPLTHSERYYQQRDQGGL